VSPNPDPRRGFLLPDFRPGRYYKKDSGAAKAAWLKKSPKKLLLVEKILGLCCMPGVTSTRHF
jgi:hypothetical protein